MSVRRIKRTNTKTGTVSESWMVDVVFEHPDGRIERIRKVSPVRTRRGAEEYERQVRAELLNPSPKPKEVPTFEQFVTRDWLSTYPHAAGNRPTTVVAKRQHVKLHLVPRLGALPLDRIGTREIEQLYAVLRRERRLSEKTVQNVGMTLHRILASAAEWGVIDRVAKFPRVKVPEPRFDYFTPPESERLVAAARTEEERALFLFALHTGARAGELLGLEWGDVDRHHHLVALCRSRTRGVTGPTKSGHGRKLPLTATLEAALESVRHERSALVFCRADGGAMSLEMLHGRLAGACRRAGLRRVRWHDLRHTFASQLVAKGIPIRQVQEWLGHATIAMTMRYAHLAPSDGARMIRLLDGNPTATGARGVAEPA